MFLNIMSCWPNEVEIYESRFEYKNSKITFITH